MDQAILDAAREWVSEHKPDLSDDEHEAAVLAAARDISAAEIAERARVKNLDN